MSRLNPVWDLESIFAGGSSSPEFAAYLEAIEADIVKLEAALAEPQWLSLLEQTQGVTRRFKQASAFISCLVAQDVKDQGAILLAGRRAALSAKFSSFLTRFDAALVAMPAAEFEALLASPEVAEFQFNLIERRERAERKMAPELEMLAGDLAVDGYHGWSQYYDTIVGRISVEWKEGEHLSAGQLFNKLVDGDRAVRQKAWRLWEEAWADASELAGGVLNHLAGFRLALYKHRGWQSVLQEPLEINRMSQATLDAMWAAVTRGKPKLVQYLERKAKLLGLKQLTWYDVDAPIGSATSKISYDEAGDFIIDQLSRLTPKQGHLAKRALEERWIEAEDRPGKRPGGFCTNFADSEESRIFMTYSGTPNNISTLAHELGHAFHQSVMNDLPQMAQGYAMNVAETASTFAEMVVSDAALKNAADDNERVALLDDKIQRAVAFFMNIHARFLFETRFYEARAKGMLTAEALNELMEAAQKEAYVDSLSLYHPTFWASKLHFYITGTPFYNFPYTFGYLFSAGIYAKAQAEGADFEEKYIALLRDTGRLTVEELAQRHLGVDLTQPEFWDAAVALTMADVDEFLKLTH